MGDSDRKQRKIRTAMTCDVASDDRSECRTKNDIAEVVLVIVQPGHGREFISSFLSVSGFSSKPAADLTEEALARVDLLDAADRKIGAYSKGAGQMASCRWRASSSASSTMIPSGPRT